MAATEPSVSVLTDEMRSALEHAKSKLAASFGESEARALVIHALLETHDAPDDMRFLAAHDLLRQNSSIMHLLARIVVNANSIFDEECDLDYANAVELRRAIALLAVEADMHILPVLNGYGSAQLEAFGVEFELPDAG